MTAPTSRLEAEIAEIPHLVARRLAAIADVDAVAQRLRARNPRFVVTIGRGSSDAVCEAIGRAAGVNAGLVAASLAPSLVTLDHARLDVRDALAIVVSQSGRSPDIIETTRAARAGGGHVVAIANVPGAPLAAVCDEVLLAGAAPEVSVAATKSVVLSWLVGLRLVAGLGGGNGSEAGWASLPATLSAAVGCAAPDEALAMLDAPALVVLGRGQSLAAAREIALKIKELAGINAEALSSAEIMHGPRAAIGPETAILALAIAAGPVEEALGVLLGLTKRIVVAGPDAQRHAGIGPVVHVPTAAMPLADPIVTTAALYPLAVALARRRGRDPDAPRGLAKVTLTR